MPTETAKVSTKRGAVTPNAQYGIHKFGYILGKTLGSGAYAKVKTATSLKGHKEVAVKIIDKKTAPKDVVSKFLPREIDVLKTIDHENIVKLLDVVDTAETMYLVMELATSGDLLDFINSRRYLSERVAKNFFTDLVNGIEVCHTNNIVHRDLKCENLLLDARLKLKISDFGFARRTEGQNLETYCGSYAYAAPEVILGQPYFGQAADIWSMGVVLFAMLAGKLPFKDSDVRTLLAEISSCLVFPSRLGDDVKNLISRMLTFSPQDRITIEEIKAHPWMKQSTSTKENKKASTKDAKSTAGKDAKEAPPSQEQASTGGDETKASTQAALKATPVAGPAPPSKTPAAQAKVPAPSPKPAAPPTKVTAPPKQAATSPSESA